MTLFRNRSDPDQWRVLRPLETLKETDVNVLHNIWFLLVNVEFTGWTCFTSVSVRRANHHKIHFCFQLTETKKNMFGIIKHCDHKEISIWDQNGPEEDRVSVLQVRLKSWLVQVKTHKSSVKSPIRSNKSDIKTNTSKVKTCRSQVKSSKFICRQESSLAFLYYF